MDSQTIQELIKGIGLPGRLVEARDRLIIIDLLDDRSERFHRYELGVSAFCDLLLDWRQKMIERRGLCGTMLAATTAGAPGTARGLITPTGAA
jgi:hypothetical protein